MCSLPNNLWRFPFTSITQSNSDIVVGGRITAWANRSKIDMKMGRTKSIAHWHKINYARALTTCITKARGELYEKNNIKKIDM